MAGPEAGGLYVVALERLLVMGALEAQQVGPPREDPDPVGVLDFQEVVIRERGVRSAGV